MWRLFFNFQEFASQHLKPFDVNLYSNSQTYLIKSEVDYCKECLVFL